MLNVVGERRYRAGSDGLTGAARNAVDRGRKWCEGGGIAFWRVQRRANVDTQRTPAFAIKAYDSTNAAVDITNDMIRRAAVSDMGAVYCPVVWAYPFVS
jgi:hypothetical protein